MVLRVEHLVKSFGGVRAVDDVGFTVGAGERVALIGPNGAGKTTVFNMLNGQLRPDHGSIQIDGVEVRGRRPRAIWRRGVGRTFQITATLPSMTVAENVQMVLLSFHRRLFDIWRPAAPRYRDQALALLDRVGMADQADRASATLAYGDLKRLELAVALASRPRLLLMDEPTAGMAPRERAELMNLTAALVAESGVAVLFTEHDMDIVFGHASRIIVMNQGTIIASGQPADIRADAEVQAVYLGSGAMFAPRPGGAA